MSLTLRASWSRAMVTSQDFDERLYLAGPDVAMRHRSLSICVYAEARPRPGSGTDDGVLCAAVGPAAVRGAGRAGRTAAEGAGRPGPAADDVAGGLPPGRRSLRLRPGR